MTFEQALEYMQGLRRFGVKLGNQRFEALLARLGEPHRRFRVVHIAGTKGKGSTTAMATAILRRHGFRVGAYFSPYVYDVRERVQVDEDLIPRDDFARLVATVRPHAEALAATDLGQTTEFEMKTAVGFLYFAERAVDYAAVEVGLGGRLDATNVVVPEVSVITNIGLDHMQVLGDTHAKIAFEKAGIIKAGVPCVTATDEPSALEVIREVARERSAPLVVLRAATEPVRPTAGEAVWFPDPQATSSPAIAVRTARNEYAGLRPGLLGEFQRANAACAVVALELAAEGAGIELEIEYVRAGLSAVSRDGLPGRMQVVHRSPTVALDGAHNEMAARAIARYLRAPNGMRYERLLLVLGMVVGHEPEGVAAALAPLAATVYATQPTWSRGIPAETIAEEARKHCDDVRIHRPPIAAARAALSDAGPRDLVLITGSFYVVGDVRPEELLM